MKKLYKNAETSRLPANMKSSITSKNIGFVKLNGRKSPLATVMNVNLNSERKNSQLQTSHQKSNSLIQQYSAMRKSSQTKSNSNLKNQIYHNNQSSIKLNSSTISSSQFEQQFAQNVQNSYQKPLNLNRNYSAVSLSQSINDMQDLLSNQHQFEDQNFGTSQFQSQHMALQTNMEHPDAQLKDIGFSGYAGGSSSALARKDQKSKEIYVPLKKRLMEKSLSQSKLGFDTFNNTNSNAMTISNGFSLIDKNKQSQLNVKKVQVNLGNSSVTNSGVKVMGSYNRNNVFAQNKSSIPSSRTSIRPKSSNQVGSTGQKKKLNQQLNSLNQNIIQKSSSKPQNLSPSKILLRSSTVLDEDYNDQTYIKSSRQQQQTQKSGLSNHNSKQINTKRDTTPVPQSKKQVEVIQIMVSLEKSSKKQKQSKLKFFSYKLWRAYRRHQHRQRLPLIIRKLEEIEIKQALIEQYREFESQIQTIQKFYLANKERSNVQTSKFRYNKNGKNLLRFIKGHLLSFYNGWKLRKIYNSKFVRNAITQYADYQKFLAEMEMDPSTSEAMKKQFKQNLPRSKQQIQESIQRLMSDPLWLSKIKKENDMKKPQKVLYQTKKDRTKSQGKNQTHSKLSDDTFEKQSHIPGEHSVTTTADIKPWWEQAAEKHNQQSMRLKQNNINKAYAELVENHQQNFSRDLTPQPQKSFLKRGANKKYDPLQNARDAKKQLKIQQKNLVSQSISNIDSSALISEDFNDRLNFNSNTSMQKQINNLNLISENIKNEKSVDGMISTINRTIEKYESLIKEHQHQLHAMTETQKLQHMLFLQQASPDKNMDRRASFGFTNVSSQCLKQTYRRISAKSPTTLHTATGAQITTRDSYSGSINESILIEKETNKDELLRNLMPSQRIAYMKKKSQDEFELQQSLSMKHQRSNSNIIPSININAGPYKEEQTYPKFTKTGLMITSQDPFQKAQQSSNNKFKRHKMSNEGLSSKHQPNLQTIKEATADLSYLKKVKSKVDCWTSRLQTSQVQINTGSKNQDNNKQSQKRLMNLSPQKSPKMLDISSVTPLKDKKQLMQVEQNSSIKKVNPNSGKGSRNQSPLKNTNSSPQLMQNQNQNSPNALDNNSSSKNQQLTLTVKKLDRVRDSILDDEMCNQDSPKGETLNSDMNFQIQPSLDTNQNPPSNSNQIFIQEQDLQEKLQVLDQMNEMLRKLKSQFQQDEKVGKEAFQDILHSNFENVLVNMKEEYTMMFQSNRNVLKTEQSDK
eukprot:403375616